MVKRKIMVVEDYMLLDMVMPVVGAYEFLATVDNNPEYFSIPVIVTTQNSGESEEMAALSGGAADFVTKPCRSQSLLHRAGGIIHPAFYGNFLRINQVLINLLGIVLKLTLKGSRKGGPCGGAH